MTAPTVTAISPTAGMEEGGTVITLTGTDFTGATAVTFGGVPATSFTINADADMTVVSPAGSESPTDLYIVVTNASGSSAEVPAATFRYVSRHLPFITSVSPATGPLAGLNVVVINGGNFDTAAQDETGEVKVLQTTEVTFGGISALSYSVFSDGMIQATVPPAEVPSVVDVRVRTESWFIS